MALAGVKCNDSCKISFDEMHLKKKHKFITFIIDHGEIKPDIISEPDMTYEDFFEEMIKQDENGVDQCRYGVYDYRFIVKTPGSDDVERSRLILFLWCPDTARTKMKMHYASAFDAIKNMFTAVQIVIQANDESELSKDTVENKVQSAARK